MWRDCVCWYVVFLWFSCFLLIMKIEWILVFCFSLVFFAISRPIYSACVFRLLSMYKYMRVCVCLFVSFFPCLCVSHHLLTFYSFLVPSHLINCLYLLVPPHYHLILTIVTLSFLRPSGSSGQRAHCLQCVHRRWPQHWSLRGRVLPSQISQPAQPLRRLRQDCPVLHHCLHYIHSNGVL